jgi:hypothetical protein
MSDIMSIISQSMSIGVCVGLTLLLTVGRDGDVRLGVEVSEAGGGLGSSFTTIAIQGNANLNAGNIAGTSAEDANSSIGVYAKTDADFSIIAAFSFGSKGTSIAAVTVSDYVAFLEQPTSTLGGQVKLQQDWRCRSATWLHCGVALNSRVFSVRMSLPEDGSELIQQINLIAIDPSLVAFALLDETNKLSVIVEVGMATRLWNKPKAEFRDALDITKAHAFAGPRVAAAISIGDIYAGVEMTRYFGSAGLEPLREFAIVPYVGIRGSLTLKPAAGTSPPSVLQLR